MQFRLLKGLKQKELAEMVGISTNYLSMIENPKNPRNPGIKLYRKLSEVLDVDISEFLDDGKSQTIFQTLKKMDERLENLESLIKKLLELSESPELKFDYETYQSNMAWMANQDEDAINLMINSLKNGEDNRNVSES